MKYASALLAAGCMLSAALAVQPSFDAREVVRQVRSVRCPASGVEHPGLDAGEFLIDTSVTLVPAPDDQSDPAIAFDGANFLVVWRDNRVGMDYSDIYGVRVTPQGTVLDPAGLVISQRADWQYSPAVGFDGTNFLVVWENLGIASYFTDIYGARVTPQGVVLDPSGFVISQADCDQFFPALAFDGTNFLVVWEDQRDDCDIYGARVTPAGTVLDPSGFVVSQARDSQCSPAVAFDGANFLVTWGDFRSGNYYFDIYGARVTPQGTVLDPAGLAISRADDNQRFPALAFDGTNFFVVWEDHRTDSDIYGARVTPAGTVLDPSGILVSRADYSRYSPALAFDGANFLVAWHDYRSGCEVYGARVTPAGTVLDPSGILISRATGTKMFPALGFGGSNSLVVWEDTRGGSDSTNIYGARVAPAGTVLDTAGIMISQAADRQCSPALAFDGGNFLAVWEDYVGASDYHEIYGARVTPAGTVLDPSGFVISHAASWQQSPALAFDGANFLVVWEDQRNIPSDIYGARVTPQGTVLDPSGFAIAQGANTQAFPAVGFDGTNFLVVWADYSGYSDLYGARVTPQGTVLDPSGFAIAQAENSQYSAALAFDGANFLVVWLDLRRGGYQDVYGVRVTPAGTVLDSFIAISQAADNKYSPAISFDGADFLAAWDESRSGHHIYGARVTPAGIVSDSGPVVRQEGDQGAPALARGNGNQLFLVYQGWAGTTGGKTYTTQRIWGKMDPNPGIEVGPRPQVPSHKLVATIIRRLPQGAVAFDAMGRRVLNLRSGIFFVREAQAQAVRKVVIQR